MSRHSTDYNFENTPECLRRFEEICGQHPGAFPIVFLGRVRILNGEEAMVVVRLGVWHIRNELFSLDFTVEIYSIANMFSLPREVKGYTIQSIYIYPNNSLESPSFKAGHFDPKDGTHFSVPCKFNGMELPIEFKILPDISVDVHAPA